MAPGAPAARAVPQPNPSPHAMRHPELRQQRGTSCNVLYTHYASMCYLRVRTGVTCNCEKYCLDPRVPGRFAPRDDAVISYLDRGHRARLRRARCHNPTPARVRCVIPSCASSEGPHVLSAEQRVPSAEQRTSCSRKRASSKKCIRARCVNYLTYRAMCAYCIDVLPMSPNRCFLTSYNKITLI